MFRYYCRLQPINININTEKILSINIKDKNIERIQNPQKEQRHKTVVKMRFKTEQKPT